MLSRTPLINGALYTQRNEGAPAPKTGAVKHFTEYEMQNIKNIVEHNATPVDLQQLQSIFVALDRQYPTSNLTCIESMMNMFRDYDTNNFTPRLHESIRLLLLGILSRIDGHEHLQAYINRTGVYRDNTYFNKIQRHMYGVLDVDAAKWAAMSEME